MHHFKTYCRLLLIFFACNWSIASNAVTGSRIKDAPRSTAETAQSYITNACQIAGRFAVSYTIDARYLGNSEGANHIQNGAIMEEQSYTEGIRVYNAIQSGVGNYFFLYPLYQTSKPIVSGEGTERTLIPIPGALFYWQYLDHCEANCCMNNGPLPSPAQHDKSPEAYRDHINEFYRQNKGRFPSSFAFTLADYQKIVNAQQGIQVTTMRVYIGKDNTAQHNEVLILVGAKANGYTAWEGTVLISALGDGHLCPYECDLF